MGNSIKTFSEFKHENNLKVYEDAGGIFNFIGNISSSLGTGISDVIKGKATSYLMEFFGITEQSIFSKLVQNFVEQIPVMDLFGIIFQGKGDSAYMAPKAADATIEFLTEKGLDGIAKDLKIETDGWIYRTISEMLSNQSRKEDFRKMLVAFYTSAFNGFETVDTDEFAKSLSPEEQRKFQNELKGLNQRTDGDLDIETEGSSKNIISDFLSGLMGGGQSTNSFGLSTGETR